MDRHARQRARARTGTPRRCSARGRRPHESRAGSSRPRAIAGRRTRPGARAPSSRPSNARSSTDASTSRSTAPRTCRPTRTSDSSSPPTCHAPIRATRWSAGPRRPRGRLDDLAPGSRVGTDSPRRTGFVLAPGPDLVLHPLHGNVDTRLRRLRRARPTRSCWRAPVSSGSGSAARIAQRLGPRAGAAGAGPGGDRHPGPARRRADARRWPPRSTTAGHGPRSRRSEHSSRRPAAAVGRRSGRWPAIRSKTIELLVGHASPDGTMTVARAPQRSGRRGATEWRGSLPRTLMPEARLGGSPRRRHGAGFRADPLVCSSAARPGRREHCPGLSASDGIEPVEVPAIEIELEPPVARPTIAPSGRSAGIAGS